MAVATSRTNLNELVYGELRTRILARKHAAGEKLGLHHLAEELGVSRSSVHHALTRLVSEGLLTVRSRRGYFADHIETGRRIALEAIERAGGVL
jgi:DNA-binding GntR family transcriptional regulator